MAAPKKDDKKKAPAPVKKKPASKVGRVYEIAGGQLKRKNKHCPKCGTGTFLANHKDRWACGKCKYTERK
jgi:small subunit ribosomal protein S27Ae